ncbi:MAG: hypothetical protein QOE58_1913 [Actinomycetota bacterium]|jgi:hypothetical protein|nr:hypothetical protein [Actinomycetota bacterium]
MGLRRSDFDLVAGVVHVERAVSEIGARQIIKRPKTAAGVRTVALPRWLVPNFVAILTCMPSRARTGVCSLGQRVPRHCARTSRRSGRVPSIVPGLWVFIFTTYGIPGTILPRGLARVLVN